MQTSINVAQAFGLVGEMYDLTPRRVDAFEASYEVEMGKLAGMKPADGTVGPLGSTYSAFKGVFVRPHEMINYGTSDGALAASLKVPAGTTVQVCSMGRVVMQLAVSVTGSVTTASYADVAAAGAAAKDAALAALKAIVIADGSNAYADTNGGTYELTSTSTSNTKVGIFIKGVNGALDVAKGAAVEYTDAAMSGANTVVTASYKALVVVQFG